MYKKKTYWFNKVLMSVRINVDFPTFLAPQTKMTAQPSMSPKNETYIHLVSTGFLRWSPDWTACPKVAASVLLVDYTTTVCLTVAPSHTGAKCTSSRKCLWMRAVSNTSAGADHRVESISVALRHTESLNAADEWNHSQAIEWSVKNRWYEFALSRSEGKLALRDLWDWSHDLSMILESVTQRTTGGLNNSLRSGKLERNRVSRLSMGSSKMMDEVGVICFSNFFRDAVQSTDR